MSLKDGLIQSAINKVRSFASGIGQNISNSVNDNRGLFQQGKFTPLKAIESAIPGGFAGAKQRLQSTPWQQFTPLSMKESAVPAANAVFGKNSFAANTIGYGLRGAISLTPMGGLGTTNLTNYIKPNSIPVFNPQTSRQQTSQDIGQALYGTALTAPLGGANVVKNIGSRLIQGAALGSGMKVAGNVLTGQNAFKDLGQGAIRGIENSWKLAITNSLTDKFASKFLPSLTSGSLVTGGNLLKNTVSMGNKVATKKLFTHNVVKLFERALLEVPAENTLFVAVDKLNGKDKRKFMDAWVQELPGNILGNIAFAGLAVGKQSLDLQKPQIDIAKEAFNKVATRMFGGSLESQSGKIGFDAKVLPNQSTPISTPQNKLIDLKPVNTKDGMIQRILESGLGDKKTLSNMSIDGVQKEWTKLVSNPQTKPQLIEGSNRLMVKSTDYTKTQNELNYFDKSQISPEVGGVKQPVLKIATPQSPIVKIQQPEPILPWEEPSYVSKNLGLKTKETPLLKTGILKQELDQLSKAPTQKVSRPIISPELKTDIQKVENIAPKKVNLLDWFRTPDRVLQKIGLGKQAENLKTSYNKYLDELPIEISKITKWYNQVKNSPDANKRLFQYLDGQDIQLSKTELKVAGEMKSYLKDWANKLDLPEDKRVASYITHIFEKDFIKKDFDEDIAKIISEKVPGSVYDPFLQQRLGKQGYVEDVFRALDAYTKRAVRKFNMDTALEGLSKEADKLPLESWKYVKSYADRVNLRPTDIDTYIDNLVKESPVGYKFGARPVTSVTRKLRQQVYRGTLGLNIGSSLRNLTQGVNTYAKLGEKYTGVGYIKTLQDLVGGGDELTKSGILRDSFIQDRQLSSSRKLMEKLDKGLMSFFNFAEKINRGAAYFGAKAQGLKQGLSEADAIAKGVKLARDTQFTFGAVDTPVAMQSDLAKTLGQFQSFNIKQTEFLGEMIGGKDVIGMLRWIGANALIMFTVGKLIGIEPKDIIPFGNILAGDTKLGQTPPIQLAGDIYGAAINAPDKYGNTDKDTSFVGGLKRVGGAIVKNAPAWIPAGVQAKKTIQGIKAVKEKGSFSKTGKLQYPIETTLQNYVRAGMFGKSNLPAAKEYFKSDGSPLGEKQTEFYKQSTDKQGVYKTFMDERTAKRELEAQKETLMGGVTSKQVGDKILYLNENNEVSTLDLSKYDTIANMPSSNKYQTAIKESKQYSAAATLLDKQGLTPEQKTTALKRLGINETMAKYYQVANDNTNLKTLYVMDKVQNATDKNNLIEGLANLRKQVNGQMIASNAVLDNLVDEGVISKVEATELKKYKFESGKLTPIKTTAKKPKKIKVTLRKMKKIAVKKAKVTKIKIKAKAYKPIKFKIPKKLKIKKIAINRSV